MMVMVAASIIVFIIVEYLLYFRYAHNIFSKVPLKQNIIIT